MHYRLSVLLRRRPRQRSAVREGTRFDHSEPFKFFPSPVQIRGGLRSALRPRSAGGSGRRDPTLAAVSWPSQCTLNFLCSTFQKQLQDNHWEKLHVRHFFCLCSSLSKMTPYSFFPVHHSNFHSNVSEIQIVAITLVFFTISFSPLSYIFHSVCFCLSLIQGFAFTGCSRGLTMDPFIMSLYPASQREREKTI